MSRINKIFNIIIYIWCVFSFIALLTIGSIAFIGKHFIKNLNSEKAIEEYIILYELLADKDFFKGEIIENKMILLTMDDGVTKELLYQSNSKYIYGMYRDANNEIILQSSGGIFASDSEIVFTENMIFDQKKYVSIKQLDSNVFLCELRR